MEISTGRVSRSSELAGDPGDARADTFPHRARRRHMGYAGEQGGGDGAADMTDDNAEGEIAGDEQPSHQLDDTA